MSLFKDDQHSWGNLFDHTWRDFTRELLPDGKWKMRTKEIADRYRELGWAQKMTPQEARFRGMIELLDEYVRSSDGRYADLAHFADVLAFATPKGLALPENWRQIHEEALALKANTKSEFAQDPLAYVAGNLIYPVGPIAIAVQVFVLLTGYGWKSLTMLDGFKWLGFDMKTDWLGLNSALTRMPLLVGVVLIEILAILTFVLFVVRLRRTRLMNNKDET